MANNQEQNLATPQPPKPAGAVPLPEVAATVCLTPDGYAHGHMLDLQVQVKPMETFAIGDRLCRYEDAIRYGDAREAAARGAVPANWNEDSSLETWFPYTAEPLKALEAENEKLRATGRADAVPAWFGELPAPISNPEAWPANYAGGYNDALNMCYDVIRGHAPQQMTTQGEAVAVLSLPEDGAYIIKFDDASVEDEFFAMGDAREIAFHRFDQISGNWNAHLFVKIRSNYQGNPCPSARFAPQHPAAVNQPMTTQGEAAIRAIISDLRNYGTPELPKRWERISSLRLTDIVADELEAAITGPQP